LHTDRYYSHIHYLRFSKHKTWETKKFQYSCLHGQIQEKETPTNSVTVINSSKPTPPLSDSRIVSLENLPRPCTVQAIVSHTESHWSANQNSSDDQTTVVLDETCRNGLASTLTTHCFNWNEEFMLHASSKVKGLTGKPYWEANIATTWDQMSTGDSLSMLEEKHGSTYSTCNDKKAFMAAE